MYLAALILIPVQGVRMESGNQSTQGSEHLHSFLSTNTVGEPLALVDAHAQYSVNLFLHYLLTGIQQGHWIIAWGLLGSESVTCELQLQHTYRVFSDHLVASRSKTICNNILRQRVLQVHPLNLKFMSKGVLKKNIIQIIINRELPCVIKVVNPIVPPRTS